MGKGGPPGKRAGRPWEVVEAAQKNYNRETGRTERVSVGDRMRKLPGIYEPLIKHKAIHEAFQARLAQLRRWDVRRSLSRHFRRITTMPSRYKGRTEEGKTFITTSPPVPARPEVWRGCAVAAAYNFLGTIRSKAVGQCNHKGILLADHLDERDMAEWREFCGEMEKGD